MRKYSTTPTAANSSLSLLGAAVILCHTVSSIFHEGLFKSSCSTAAAAAAAAEEHLPRCDDGEYHWIGVGRFPWALTLVEYLAYASLAAASAGAGAGASAPGGGGARSTTGIPALLRRPQTWLLSLCHLGAHGMTNASLAHVNFATKLVFKSCKVLPVMAGSALLLGKAYSRAEVGAALAMCGGLAVFSLADVAVAGGAAAYDATGLALCAAALVCEAFVGNVQEKLLRRGGGGSGAAGAANAAQGAANGAAVSKEALMAAQFGFGSLLCAGVCVANGEAAALAEILLRGGAPPGLPPVHGARWARDAALRAALFTLPMFAGLSAIMRIVAVHGAVATVAVTTTRRVLTMALSFALYPKPLTAAHAAGLAAVLGAVALLAREKARRAAPPAAAAHARRKLQ